MAVDEIVRRHGFSPFRSRFRGQAAEGTVGGTRVLALKPQTFMNNSGHSVGEAARFYKIPTGLVTVLHDELDLRPGKVRVKLGGGNAGHNGLKSIEAAIGGHYRRVRLGIGHPGDRDRVMSYVLNDFARADGVWLEPLLDAVAEAFPLLVQGDDGAFMSKIAQRVGPLDGTGTTPGGAARGGEGPGPGGGR